ncbi:MAG: HEAT repeat domain-containing protein, partial [Planctomycetales bacterium]
KANLPRQPKPRRVRAGPATRTDVQIRAAAALVAISPTDRQEQLSFLVKALESSSSDIRAVSANALGMCRESAKPAVEALMKRLEDDSERVRVESAYAMFRIAGDADGAIPVLVRAIGSIDSGTAGLASVYLASIAPKGRRVGQPLLVQAARHVRAEVRQRAIVLLPCFSENLDVTRDVLIVALGSSVVEDRLAALQAIAAMGRRAKDLQTRVQKSQQDEVESVRQMAMLAEARIQSEESCPETSSPVDPAVPDDSP